MTNVYRAWKPLRNQLRELDPIEALGVIRAYSANLYNNTPLPADITVHPNYYSDPRIILPWDLEVLAREIIVTAEPVMTPRSTLRDWRTMTAIRDKLTAIHEYIASEAINPENIMHEVTVRLNGHQFRYQIDSPNRQSLFRYANIFSHSEVVPLVQAKTGLNPLQLYTLGLGLWERYLVGFGMHYPLDDLPGGITQAHYRAFMRCFSLPFEDLRERLRSRRLDDSFAYQYHSLRAFPIIQTSLNGQPAHVCPIPSLLFWRVTGGLYYELFGERGFDRAFGTAFSDYTGKVLRAFSTQNSSIQIYAEEPDSRLRRCDWILDQEHSFMLIECKTKRLRLDVRSSLEGTAIDSEGSVHTLDSELGKLAEAVAQTYEALTNYRLNRYRDPLYSYDPRKRASICVVTLEPWYLMGPQTVRLRQLVSEKLQERSLDPMLINEAPYIIASIRELELIAFLAQTNDLEAVIRPYVEDDQVSRHELGVYLEQRFANLLANYQYPFEDASHLVDIFEEYVIP